MKRFTFIVSLLVIGLLLSLTQLSAQSDDKNYSFNDADELIRPEGYRQWFYIGTPVTPNDLNPPRAAFPEFHNVYIHPDDVDYYKNNGSCRDGTILSTELVSVGSTQASSGVGYFMGDYIGLEATIKDSSRFADEPGNWAYFSFTDEDGGEVKETATAFATASCNACHEANAAEDWVFTQYYPALRATRSE